MARYIITLQRKLVQEHLIFFEADSLGAAYAEAGRLLQPQEESPAHFDEEDWQTNEDLTSKVYCSDIMDPLGVSHVYDEIPADLATPPPIDTIDTLEVVEDGWEGAVDHIEELGQKDKDLFGPVL